LFLKVLKLLGIFFGHLFVGHEVVVDGFMLVLVKEAVILFAPHQVIGSSILFKFQCFLGSLLGNLLVQSEIIMDSFMFIFVKETVVFLTPHQVV